MEWSLSGWELFGTLVTSMVGTGGLTALLVARINSAPDAMKEGTAALTSIIQTLRDELRLTFEQLESERHGRAQDDINHAQLRHTLQRMESALIAAETLIAEWRDGPPQDLAGWQERAMRWLAAHQNARTRNRQTIETFESGEYPRPHDQHEGK